jgi:Lon-like protease
MASLPEAATAAALTGLHIPYQRPVVGENVQQFAPGIVDKRTKGNLAGGKFFAGTGEITAAGQVGAIGGIQHKMVAARSAGGTIFLTPPGNCANTAGAVPAGPRIVKVATLGRVVALDDHRGDDTGVT